MWAAAPARSLERRASISRRRLDVVPIAATILRKLIAAGRPERIIFSAFGLREGYADGMWPADPRIGPLIAACIGIAANLSRGGYDGDRLQRWTAPIFPDLDEDSHRLHRATCWLSDFAWTEHPDYRAEHAFTRALRMPVAQIAHHERVFIAAALHTRYGGASDDPIKVATRPLLADGAASEARRLGLALRLAYTLCGGALELLDQVRLARQAHSLLLELPPTGTLVTGEAVQRPLHALLPAFGRATRTLRRRSPTHPPARTPTLSKT